MTSVLSDETHIDAAVLQMTLRNWGANGARVSVYADEYGVPTVPTLTSGGADSPSAGKVATVDAYISDAGDITVKNVATTPVVVDLQLIANRPWFDQDEADLQAAEELSDGIDPGPEGAQEDLWAPEYDEVNGAPVAAAASTECPDPLPVGQVCFEEATDEEVADVISATDFTSPTAKQTALAQAAGANGCGAKPMGHAPWHLVQRKFACRFDKRIGNITMPDGKNYRTTLAVAMTLNTANINGAAGYRWEERWQILSAEGPWVGGFQVALQWTCKNCYVGPELEYFNMSLLDPVQTVWHNTLTHPPSQGQRVPTLQNTWLTVDGLGTNNLRRTTPKMRCDTMTSLKTLDTDRGCVLEDQVPTIYIERDRWATADQHIDNAQADGYPVRLTRMVGKDVDRNRRAAYRQCGQLRKDGLLTGSCDEYPMASTRQGCLQACSVDGINKSDNLGSGAFIGYMYKYYRLMGGDDFRIRVVADIP